MEHMKNANNITIGNCSLKIHLGKSLLTNDPVFQKILIGLNELFISFFCGFGGENGFRLQFEDFFDRNGKPGGIFLNELLEANQAPMETRRG